MAHLGAWGRRYLPVTEELSIRAQLMEEGGPELWERFMRELRAEHLGDPLPEGPSVRQTLQAPMTAWWRARRWKSNRPEH